MAPSEEDWCIVLCDGAGRSIGELFYQAFETISNRIVFMQSPLFAIHNGELDSMLKGPFTKTSCAVVILPDFIPASLPSWLAHLQHNRVLCVHAARPQTLLRWLQAARPRSIEKTEKLADLVSIGKKMVLRTVNGATLTLPLPRSSGIPDVRSTQRSKYTVFLPSGEVRLQPNARALTGTWRVDFISGQKHDATPVEITLKEGKLAKVRGQSATANAIRKFFKDHGANSRQVMEISLGTNDNFSFGKSAIEDRKVRGAFTITFGDPDAIAAGHASATLSLVTAMATITIDGRTIVDRGQLLI
ncbi:MAG: hypothetical protein Q9P14_08210 [candidate division KSB1 bacterium]|nr:hypothetical protein [candidate division KSB1 bacterium]